MRLIVLGLLTLWPAWAEPPLLLATYQDDLPAAQRLIAAGADVNSANRYGITPLTMACQNGNAELAKLLLAKGADPNSTRDGGETALMTASRNGTVAVVRALLTAGADFAAKEHRGQTALMWAAAEGHAEVVDALIVAGADYRKPVASGFSPLCFAARNGHIAVVRRLIGAEVDVNQAMSQARGGRNKPMKHSSPLLLAIENGHFELAQVLLEAGADPNDDRSGFAPLHVMSWVRKPPIGDGDTGTPPPQANGALTSLEFVRVLVAKGAEVNRPRKKGGARRKKIDIPGTTPFLCAASACDIPYMKLLLELGADPTLRNERGQTALMYAAGINEGPEGDGPGRKPEHLAAVTYLLDAGADINATSKDGEHAMHGAAYRFLPTVVTLLDARGADIAIWSKKSKQGRTPLSIAQGFRPGNFKPDADTIAALETVMHRHGVTPPPPPKRHEGWQP